MRNTRRAGERRHQLAHAASRVFAKEWINLQRRSRCCDSETIFAAGPHGRAIADQHWFEIEIGSVGFDLKSRRAATSANSSHVNIPILIDPKHNSPTGLGINNPNGLPVRSHIELA